MPRFRFTLRWMMVAVAIAAVAALYARRSREYRRLAQRHRAVILFREYETIDVDPCDKVQGYPACRLGCLRYPCEYCAEEGRSFSDRHTKLALKYERATRFPWLSVEPDPPGSR